MNDPLYNHVVFGPEKGKNGNIGKTDEELIRDLISIHNAENWLGMDGDSELSMFKPLLKSVEDFVNEDDRSSPNNNKGKSPNLYETWFYYTSNRTQVWGAPQTNAIGQVSVLHDVVPAITNVICQRIE